MLFVSYAVAAHYSSARRFLYAKCISSLDCRDDMMHNQDPHGTVALRTQKNAWTLDLDVTCNDYCWFGNVDMNMSHCLKLLLMNIPSEDYFDKLSIAKLQLCAQYVNATW